jgi:hypothetical protein
MATLHRQQAHDENIYHVAVTCIPRSGQTCSDESTEKTDSAGERGPKHSPNSPHSRTQPPTTGDQGNVGEQGNGSAAAEGKDVISQLSLALARPASGNVGKEGNDSARIGATNMISPDGTDAIVGSDEPLPDNWEPCQ